MLSWKDKVVGSRSFDFGCDEDLEFLDGDIMKSTVNGYLRLAFSERIQKLLVLDMATTLVVKLLGRKVSNVPLYNRISSLWKPS